MLKSFSYIVDDKTTTLIIGSMPGVASLEAVQYYAHKHNLFWRFIFKAFDEDYDMPSYQEKISFLRAHQLGLWDAAKSCERDGSLDTNIKEVVSNDFRGLFRQYPNIKRLLFNGKKAFELFKKFNKDLLSDKEYLVLPSTSPANASIPYETKREIWFGALRQNP